MKKLIILIMLLISLTNIGPIPPGYRSRRAHLPTHSRFYKSVNAWPELLQIRTWGAVGTPIMDRGDE